MDVIEVFLPAIADVVISVACAIFVAVFTSTANAQGVLISSLIASGVLLLKTIFVTFFMFRKSVHDKEHRRLVLQQLENLTTSLNNVHADNQRLQTSLNNVHADNQRLQTSLNNVHADSTQTMSNIMVHVMAHQSQTMSNLVRTLTQVPPGDGNIGAP